MAIPLALTLSIPMGVRARHAARTTLRCVMAWLVGVALWCSMATASAQAVTCGISSHSGANGSSFAFGPGGVTASASLQNMMFESGVTGGGSTIQFIDSGGRTYSTPAGPGRWTLSNSTSTTRLTVTFSPAIPAHRIGLGIYDIGLWNNSQPNNAEDPNYSPSLRLSVSGGATSSEFVAHQAGPNAQASYTPSTGNVTMDASAYVPGVQNTWRQSVVLRGNSTALVSTLTLTATNIRGGDLIGFGLVAIPSCVTISKTTEGGVGSFDFTTTNLNNWNNTAAASPITLTTTAAGSPVSSALHYYAHPIASNGQGTQPVVLSETIPSDWTLSSAQCTDANSSRNGNTGSFGSLVGGALTIPANRMRFESNITCAFTNARPAVLRLRKTLSHGRTAASDQFTLRIAEGATVLQSATTTGFGNTPFESALLSSAVAGTSYTLSEVGAGGANLTNYGTTYSCSNTLAGGQTPSGTGTTFNVTPAAGDNLTCTFSNARRPRLTLVKTVTNDNGGTQPATAWTLSAAGPTPLSGATGSTAVTDAAVNAGTYTLSESATPTGYTASAYRCIKNGGAAVSGNSIAMATGDVATCTIDNDDSNQIDLRIAKTSSPDPVTSGSRVQFTLVVSNHGPAAGHGAVVRDPAVAGLDCTAAGLPAVSCSVTGGAACPASLTASGLQAGVSIPTLPNGSVVTIGLTCDVTANGRP